MRTASGSGCVANWPAGGEHPLLLGLGLDEFSMSATAVAGCQGAAGKVPRPTRSFSRRVLDLPDAAAVKAGGAICRWVVVTREGLRKAQAVKE